MKIPKPAIVALAAVVLAYGVVGLGVFTRLVDAGLGCPDWPGCYGHLLWPDEQHEILKAEALFPDAPVDNDKTWPEMVHRYFAGTLGLLILGIAINTLSLKRHSEQPVKLSLLLLGLVITQAAFGMWTVTLKLWPQVVTAHLLGGFATLSLLWLLFLRQAKVGFNSDWITVSPPRYLTVSSVAALVIVVIQITLGGWTTSNYAALACIDFPTCHGQWLPDVDVRSGFNFFQEIGPNYLGGAMDNEARTAIHFFHRVGALVTTLVVLLLAQQLWVTQHRHFRKLSMMLIAVLFLQVTLGISNVLLALPLFVAVSHNLVGALLLLTVVTVNYQVYQLNQAREIKSHEYSAGSPVAVSELMIKPEV